jgi:hypothetical protein
VYSASDERGTETAASGYDHQHAGSAAPPSNEKEKERRQASKRVFDPHQLGSGIGCVPWLYTRCYDTSPHSNDQHVYPEAARNTC